VVRGGEPILMKGWGKADLENDVAATEHSVYRIGSVTKQFTAAAVMQLVDQGKVRLTDSIGTHLPTLRRLGWRCGAGGIEAEMYAPLPAMKRKERGRHLKPFPLFHLNPAVLVVVELEPRVKPDHVEHLFAPKPHHRLQAAEPQLQKLHILGYAVRNWDFESVTRDLLGADAVPRRVSDLPPSQSR
jgi:hypothetical protein